MLCSDGHLATALNWDNADCPADMTDATWQSEHMNPATTPAGHPRQHPILMIMDPPHDGVNDRGNAVVVLTTRWHGTQGKTVKIA